MKNAVGEHGTNTAAGPWTQLYKEINVQFWRKLVGKDGSKYKIQSKSSKSDVISVHSSSLVYVLLHRIPHWIHCYVSPVKAQNSKSLLSEELQWAVAACHLHQRVDMQGLRAGLSLLWVQTLTISRASERSGLLLGDQPCLPDFLPEQHEMLQEHEGVKPWWNGLKMVLDVFPVNMELWFTGS